jgi:LmbE family N-acetylglucosaminyl deacetylase
MKNVLVVSAHPDDLELSCGGTVAKMISQGASVTNLIMVGNVPHVKYLDNASKVLGYTPLIYSLENPRFAVNSQTISSIDEIVKSIKPDLIITHWEEDWHQDHRACNEIVSIIRRNQPVDVWHMNSYPYNLKYKNFNPNLYVDITDFAFQKYDAIAEYSNVSEWAEQVASHDSWRGGFINTTAAEVFSVDSMVLY